MLTPELTGPTTSGTSRRRTYWAGEEDLDKLCRDLMDKRNRFNEFLLASRLYSRIKRNWEYWCNLYPGGGGPMTEISRAGKEGQFSLIAVNHFRSILHLLITYTLRNRPDWDCRAINHSTRAIEQTKLSKQLLDYYMKTQGVENQVKRVVEQGMILTCSYLRTAWNPTVGELWDGDPETGSLEAFGDIEFSTHSVFDVTYDFANPDRSKSPWELIHRLEPRWDLVEGFPEVASELIDLPSPSFEFAEQNVRLGFAQDSDDLIDTYEFIHKRTPGLRQGRYFKMAGGKIPLIDGPNPYNFDLLHRFAPAEFTLTSFGYSPGFDIQGLQEALNMEYSTIITNHANLGPTKIWFKKDEEIVLADLEPGTNAIQTETEPKPIKLSQTTPEMLNMPGNIVKDMEYTTGVNAVSRGQPEASYRSGVAMGFVDSKTDQYNSLLQANFASFMSSVGTSIIKLCKAHYVRPRMLALLGETGTIEEQEFSAEKIELVDKVIVDLGNPAMKNLGFRQEIANFLVQNKLVNTPEEYLTLLNSGQIKSLTEAVDSQLSLVHEENRALKSGVAVNATQEDNQLLHIKKHSAVLDCIDTRLNSPFFFMVKTHILQHIKMLYDPVCQALQVAMGWADPQQLQLVMQIALPGIMAGQPGMGEEKGEPAPPKPGQAPNPAATQAQKQGVMQ